MAAKTRPSLDAEGSPGGSFSSVSCWLIARSLCVSIMIMVWCVGSSGCASAPSAATATVAPKPAPSAAKPEIYDPHADGEELLETALATARQENKRVLLDLGANWCSDSQAMFRRLKEDPEIAAELARHFVLVLVDVNEKDGPPRNRPLLQRLNDPLQRGIPVLLVLAGDGTLLNTDAAERLADSDHQHPELVLACLRKWAGGR